MKGTFANSVYTAPSICEVCAHRDRQPTPELKNIRLVGRGSQVSTSSEVDFGESEHKPKFFHSKLEISQVLAFFNKGTVLPHGKSHFCELQTAAV